MVGKAFGVVIAGLVMASTAHAQEFADVIVAQLRADGFSEIATEQTWLGRTRIVASGAEGKREIVVNPNTGEILRDLWLNRGGSDGGSLASSSSGGNDDSDRDDDGDDDGSDNDSGDDNGGNSGSSSGGSGGSGGGSGGDDSGGGNGGDSD